MRRSQRLIASLVALALCSVLAGCGGGGMSNFDPSDLLDFLDTKKKLPGERKPVFPEGVPGLEQGVPKDLYKGARQEQIDQQNANAAAAAAAAAAGRAAEVEEVRQGQVGRSGRRQHGAGGRACRGGRSRCRALRGGGACRAAARAEAEEDCAQAHHRAAARSVRRSRRRQRNPPNNRRRRSPRRCRAAALRASFCYTSLTHA